MSTTPHYPTSPADQAALRDLFQGLIDSWNSGSGDAYAAQFTEDSDYIAFNGEHFKGRRKNAEVHQKLFDTFLKGSTLEGQDISSLRLLTPEVAILHAIGTVKLRWQKHPAPGRKAVQTLVAVKRDRTWRFAAFHNSRIARPNLLNTFMLGRR